MKQGYIYVSIPKDKVYKIYSTNCQKLPLASISKVVRQAVAAGAVCASDNVSIIIDPACGKGASVKSIKVSNFIK